MNKASMMDCELTIRSIKESEMGFLLLEANEKSMYDVLINQTSYEDRQGMYGDGCHIIYHLYPLMYTNDHITTNADLIKSRADAVNNIFKRWTLCGYNKSHTKNHFSCMAFNQYLDDIGFLKADYMLLLVE